jgi:hypothetical protein
MSRRTSPGKPRRSLRLEPTHTTGRSDAGIIQIYVYYDFPVKGKLGCRILRAFAQTWDSRNLDPLRFDVLTLPRTPLRVPPAKLAGAGLPVNDVRLFGAYIQRRTVYRARPKSATPSLFMAKKTNSQCDAPSARTGRTSVGRTLLFAAGDNGRSLCRCAHRSLSCARCLL